MIAAVLTVRNEADVIECSLRHLLDQGVDRIYVAEGRSSDGTQDILQDLRDETGRICWVDDHEPCHRQQEWTDRLARWAHEDGAEWIIAADADEFWCAEGRTVAEALSSTTASVVLASVYVHPTWERRRRDPQPWPSVAYRWCEGAAVDPGNHGVVGVSGHVERSLLAVRELQYRSFEHFVAKMRDRNARIDPALPPDAGWHHRRLAEFTEDELRAEWAEMQAAPSVEDPIPCRFRPSAS